MKIHEVRVGQQVKIENRPHRQWIIDKIDTETYAVYVKTKRPYGQNYYSYAHKFYVWLLIDDSPPLEQLARAIFDEA